MSDDRQDLESLAHWADDLTTRTLAIIPTDRWSDRLTYVCGNIDEIVKRVKDGTPPPPPPTEEQIERTGRMVADALDQRDNRARIAELEAERDQLRDAIETKVAQWLCPVHGSAACPEEYRLMHHSGDVAPGYKDTWDESMRCGQRPTTAAVLGEQSEATP